jgi:hypothetical protein
MEKFRLSSDPVGEGRGKERNSMSGTSSDLVPNTPSDGAEVEGVARDYIDGWYAGDVERMDRALHAELVKRIPPGRGTWTSPRGQQSSHARAHRR